MKLELFVPTLGLKNDFRKSNFRGNETCNETLLNQFKKRMIRKFLSEGLLFMCMTLLIACEMSETKKPLNILWLVAEDLSPDYLNSYGDFRAPTPIWTGWLKKG